MKPPLNRETFIALRASRTAHRIASAIAATRMYPPRALRASSRQSVQDYHDDLLFQRWLQEQATTRQAMDWAIGAGLVLIAVGLIWLAVYLKFRAFFR